MILGTACALLVLQLYVIAPLIPEYNREFKSSLMHLAIPAFAIPFALVAAGMCLFPSAIRKPDNWLSVSLVVLSAGCVHLSLVHSWEAFFINRILTGLGTGTLLPAALIMGIRSVNKKRSFTNLVIIIFFLATGMTFAPSTGGWLNGSLGWRLIYQVIGILAALLWLGYLWFKAKDRNVFFQQRSRGKEAPGPGSHRTRINKAVYSFVYLSGVFHSGFFVWIIYHFSTEYKLDAFNLANALLIFGLPGLMITVLMFFYRLDTRVLAILYSGLLITIMGMIILIIHPPLWLAQCLLAAMSVGYCFSQPLFIGIIKLPTGGLFAGKLIALGSGVLFAGYGTGPLIMSLLLETGPAAPVIFLLMLILALAMLSRRIWHIRELHRRHRLLYKRSSNALTLKPFA